MRKAKRHEGFVQHWRRARREQERGLCATLKKEEKTNKRVVQQNIYNKNYLFIIENYHTTSINTKMQIL